MIYMQNGIFYNFFDLKNEKISYFDDEQNHLNLRSSIIDDHRFISILNDTRHVQDHLHFQISIHEFVSWIINILEAMKMMEAWVIRVNDQVYSERYILRESSDFFVRHLFIFQPFVVQSHWQDCDLHLFLI